MNSRMLQVLGIVFVTFLAGVTVTNPMASAAAKAPANVKPPPFQSLVNNLISPDKSTIWIGGVAGYSTVTIVLSAINYGEIAGRPEDVSVYVCFQTGTTFADPTSGECMTQESFIWPNVPSNFAIQYPVGAAETIVIVIAPLPSTVAASMAILAT